uniref:Cadherin related family member 2 n=1 Tax=Latimeria chalumnae TaxID=7897 RepID=H3B6M0_LATCH
IIWWLICFILHCLILVSGNLAPGINVNMSVLQLREDLKKGETAFWISASDPENDPLTYSMTGEYKYHFNVMPSTGEVKIAEPLDADEGPSHFEVTLQVQDQQNFPTSRKTTIIIENANDNRPLFTGAPYTAHVNETAKINEVLFQVKATDRDDKGGVSSVTYEIINIVPVDQQNNKLFLVDPKGYVRLNGTLDYNSKSTYYQLLMEARDQGGILHGEFIYQNSTAYAFINIIDLPNLNPRFINEPYHASVQENSPKGTPVVQVYAVDNDKGINDQIKFSIAGTASPELFDIHESTGKIVVNGSIDREKLLPLNEVVLKVVATEKNQNIYGQTANATTDVTIRITDVNDNKPMFYNCTRNNCDFSNNNSLDVFTGEIKEHSSTGMAVSKITLVVRDPDEGDNAASELSLKGPDASAFFVSPEKIVNTAMVQILVNDSNAVDYEKKKIMAVTVVACNIFMSNFCSEVNVTINILDINDNSPEFQQETYKLHVAEHTKTGSVISNITAYDPDTGKFGTITYRLLPTNINRLSVFEVNHTTGEILVKDEKALDRETRPVYYVTLQAMDGENRTSSTVLEIILDDINDQAPITRDSYTEFVKEAGGTLSLQIEAIDNDDPNTNNSIVHYEILGGDDCGNFTIDVKTGLLKNNGPLDREAINVSLQGKIVLNVKAYDLGTPSLYFVTNVSINVQDINDNAPIFTQSEYQVSVKESEKVGIAVGAVEAEDADQTEANYHITFRISDGGLGNFIIRTIPIWKKSYSGNITVDPGVELDYEVQKSFTLTIEATDIGTEISNTASAIVKVEVLDVNDEPPTLDMGSLKDLKVKENTTNLGIVRNIEGNDVDTNHSLIYKKISVTCYKRSADIIDIGDICMDWVWLHQNGSLFVNENSVIDYEKCDQVKIIVQVIDTKTEKGKNHSESGQLRMNILDINDNAPQFISNEIVFVVVPEIAPKDFEVASVKARDIDSGENGVIIFTIAHVMFIYSTGESRPLKNVFNAVTLLDGASYTGSIRIANSLDSTLKGQYKVTVEARNKVQPLLKTVIELDIFTVDQSYRVSLEFERSSEDVQANSDQIIWALTEATKATVYVSAIKSLTNVRNSAVR